jgi:hypothetical protein
VKTFWGILLLVIAVVVGGVLLAVNSTTQNGAVLGLLIGALLAATRVAGVDFRQWFRDPGEPLPINDDTAYGLTRTAIHATLGAGALVFVFGSLFVSPSPWLPQSCRPAYDWGVVRLPQHWDAVSLLDRLSALSYLKRWGADAFFVDCAGSWSSLKLGIGIAIGVVLIQAIFELAWRRGLTLLPNPRLPARLRAPQSVPRVRFLGERCGERRRLIVCCDGTWNWPESRRETNVIRLVRSIAPVHNGISQTIYYHQGVGTGNILDRMVGGGAGVGLSNSVRTCYGFLADNYREGDEIFLFGFSRGAFVARSIAGVIGTVGMLRKSEMERFFEVWDWYSQPREERRPADLTALAPDRHKEVDIECVGVWDTVGALGIPGSRFCAKAFAFYETGLGAHVRHGFQALAVDERRGNFQAAVWVPSRAAGNPAAQPRQPQPAPAQPAPAQPGVPQGPWQVLEQVWFPGVHSNIGGGYEQHGLSDTTFLWMLAKLREHDLLGLHQVCVTRALDPTEPYATGALQNSLTIFWRLIGSPVPRPICIISPTERVYDSAWQRGRADNICPVPEDDVYLRPRRERWLAAMDTTARTRRVVRAQFEEANAVTQPGPPALPPRQMSNNIGFCGRVLQYVAGRG